MLLYILYYDYIYTYIIFVDILAKQFNVYNANVGRCGSVDIAHSLSDP